MYVERLQCWNCIFVTLFEFLNKNKNPDGLVWTIFSGRNPKVGVNHVNSAVGFVLLCCAGLFSFVYMMMML